MPESKEGWLALILMIIIPVAIIGPMAGYSVSGVTVHDPAFIFRLMAFGVESVPVAVSAFFDILVLMAGIILVQIASVMTTTGAIILAATGVVGLLAGLWAVMS